MTAKANVVGGAMVSRSTGRLAPVIADKGVPGPTGAGWTPILSGEADGTRTLIKVSDWVGGTGDKPQAGMYIGTAGYVTNKQDAFNFNAIKRVFPMSAVTNAQGIATFNFSSFKFTNPPQVIPLPATTSVISGPTRSVETGVRTALQAQVKVDQAGLLTGVLTVLVGATANILVIET